MFVKATLHAFGECPPSDRDACARARRLALSSASCVPKCASHACTTHVHACSARAAAPPHAQHAPLQKHAPLHKRVCTATSRSCQQCVQDIATAHTRRPCRCTCTCGRHLAHAARRAPTRRVAELACTPPSSEGGAALPVPFLTCALPRRLLKRPRAPKALLSHSVSAAEHPRPLHAVQVA